MKGDLAAYLEPGALLLTTFATPDKMAATVFWKLFVGRDEEGESEGEKPGILSVLCVCVFFFVFLTRGDGRADATT